MRVIRFFYEINSQVLSWECELGLVAGHWLCFWYSFMFIFIFLYIREDVSEFSFWLHFYDGHNLCWPVSMKMKSQVKLRDVIEYSQRERSENQTKQKKQSNTGFVNCLQLKPLPSVYFQKMLYNYFQYCHRRSNFKRKWYKIMLLENTLLNQGSLRPL